MPDPPDPATRTGSPSTVALPAGSLAVPVPGEPAVPGYDILGEIARGGMGVVYSARQHGTNRVVAIKTITAGRAAGAAEKARFRAEAEAAAALDHPGIVPIYEVGEAAGQPFFSMKQILGRSLQAALADPAWKPPTADRVRLLAEVCRAVHHAHQRGIIHRDLKPGNVLLDEAGRPHVADFGLAKRVAADDALTLTGAVLGTPAYMSPEQAAGGSRDATTLSDVYSLGAILYELLTGRRPFSAETPLALIHKVAAEPPDPPSRHARVDRDLEAVCLKCLAKAPAGRYESVAALADDLDRWAAGEPIAARPPSLAFLMWQWVRANVRTAVWVTLIGLFCSLIGCTAVLYFAALVMFKHAARAYDSFPSRERPWVLRIDWDRVDRAIADTPWADFMIAAAGVTAAGGMGLFVVAVARPRDRWGDLTAGLGVGTVAGLTFTFGGGLQAALLALVVVPQITDHIRLTDGCFVRSWPPPDRIPVEGPPPPHPADALVEDYPDLKPMSETDRAGKFMALRTADEVTQVFQCVWLGGVLFLAGGLVVGVLQTMTAGFLRRRYGAWRRVVPRYAVATVACYPLLSWVTRRSIGVLFFDSGASLGEGVGLVLIAVVLAVGATRGTWVFSTARLFAAAVLVTFGVLLAVDMSHKLAGIRRLEQYPLTLAIGFVLAGVAFVIWGRGDRKRKAAASNSE